MAREKIYENDAARVAAHRARHGLKTLSVDLSPEVCEGLENYMKFKNLTKRQVIEGLIRNNIMRKR